MDQQQYYGTSATRRKCHRHLRQPTKSAVDYDRSDEYAQEKLMATLKYFPAS